jgi:toxin-antitoxin system PIN domain toxin
LIALLDVNVLVALFDDGHIGHEAAHDWFTDNRALGWASCPITENGVMRVLGNPSYPAGATPIPEIAARLDTFCAATEHHFWPDDVSFRNRAPFLVDGVRGYRQLTDIYLLGLAAQRGGRFVTFDRRVPLGAVNNATRASLEVIASAE